MSTSTRRPLAGKKLRGKVRKGLTCPYCGKPAKFLGTSDQVYHGTDYGPVYVCMPCSAWVGCHPGTKRPLGRLANAELRKAKRAAHVEFDQLWQAKIRLTGCPRHEARGKAYAWLAGKLGIEGKRCHIGMFDLDLCRRVVEVCAPYTRKGAKS